MSPFRGRGENNIVHSSRSRCWAAAALKTLYEYVINPSARSAVCLNRILYSSRYVSSSSQYYNNALKNTSRKGDNLCAHFFARPHRNTAYPLPSNTRPPNPTVGTFGHHSEFRTYNLIKTPLRPLRREIPDELCTYTAAKGVFST